jgi:hypothetical protein
MLENFVTKTNIAYIYDSWNAFESSAKALFS